MDEDGTLLIICYGPFMETMQPLVDWKNKKGTFTEMVDVADIGDNDAIKSYVEDYYYDYGLTFLLLVGDIDQIPSPRFSEGAGSNSPADPSYGFIVGNDYYPDVFVGRFSAENTTHVETMVNRTLQYERYPDGIRKGQDLRPIRVREMTASMMMSIWITSGNFFWITRTFTWIKFMILPVR